MNDEVRQLFCYGSLQVAEVIHAVIGRAPEGVAASLADHALFRVCDVTYPGVAPVAGATAPGMVYDGLTDDEFARLDHFEGEPYVRGTRPVHLADGTTTHAWVYLLPPENLHWLTNEPWDLDSFRRDGLKEFMRRCFGVE